MDDIYRNRNTNNYDVPISTDDWKEILVLPEIINDAKILIALEKWYLAPNFTSTCKSLGEQCGLSHNFFSVQNQKLGRIVIRHLNRFRLINKNGKETYWSVAWIELNKIKGLCTLHLRPELVTAIKELGLFFNDADNAVKQYLLKHDFRNEKDLSFNINR